MLNSTSLFYLPSLTIKRSPFTGKGKKNKEYGPIVDVQGKKCFVKLCEEISFKNTSKILQNCYNSRISISSGSDSIGNDDVDGRTVTTSKDFSLEMSALEGRKLNIRLLEKTTIKRVNRSRCLRFQEANEFVDLRNELHKYDTSKVVSLQHKESPKDTTKNVSKRVLEIPKVESYEILTPRQIISSETCEVLGRGASAEMAYMNYKKSQGTESSVKRKTVFDKRETNFVEFRNPSPVQGMRLNPREELERIDKALDLVEKNNFISNSSEENFSDDEKLTSKPDPQVVKKFVIRLPPIY